MNLVSILNSKNRLAESDRIISITRGTSKDHYIVYDGGEKHEVIFNEVLGIFENTEQRILRFEREIHEQLIESL